MKWCKSNTKGTHYLLSFAIGAALVTTALWGIRYFINVVLQKGDFVAAYHGLPSFHLRVMWKAGGLSGLLWSIGNYFSLISVFYLGEGVGYPLVQSAILVSGLWGIFYFGEVKGRDRIAMWMLSSLVTVFGILLLSYEHHEM
jgi:glucose uptake protein GlcU